MKAYDRAIGVRVGTMAGAVIGGVAMAISGYISYWVMVGAAAIGGAVGYRMADHETSD